MQKLTCPSVQTVKHDCGMRWHCPAVCPKPGCSQPLLHHSGVGGHWRMLDCRKLGSGADSTEWQRCSPGGLPQSGPVQHSDDCWTCSNGHAASLCTCAVCHCASVQVLLYKQTSATALPRQQESVGVYALWTISVETAFRSNTAAVACSVAKQGACRRH